MKHNKLKINFGQLDIGFSYYFTGLVLLALLIVNIHVHHGVLCIITACIIFL